MNFRPRNQFAVLAAIMAWQGAFLHAQGVGRQQSYKPLQPLAGPSRGSNGSSPLGIVDDSVNQTVDPGVDSQFDAVQSGASGLDHLNSSSRAGGRKPSAAFSVFTVSGPQRPLTAQANASTTNAAAWRSLRQVSPNDSLLTPGGQRGPIGLTPKAPGLKSAIGVRGGQVGSSRRAGGAPGQTGSSALRLRNSAESIDFSAEQESGLGALETLQDPFLAASRASFEGFTKGFGMERLCGVACSLRISTQSAPATGERRRPPRLADVPDAQIPVTKGVYGQEPGLLTEPVANVPVTPY